MIKRLALATVAAALLGWNSAHAQATGSPLGFTSPLGMGPGASVGPVGIPLGATELASPGVSPTTSGVSPVDASTCGTTGSAMDSSTGSTTGMSGSSSVFDGGGTGGTSSGCTASGSSSGSPAASASSPSAMGSTSPGRAVGIPLGSTELSDAGTSPPPVVPTINPAAPTLTLSPMAPAPVMSPSVPAPISSSTSTCTTGAGGPQGISSTPVGGGTTALAGPC